MKTIEELVKRKFNLLMLIALHVIFFTILLSAFISPMGKLPKSRGVIERLFLSGRYYLVMNFLFVSKAITVIFCEALLNVIPGLGIAILSDYIREIGSWAVHEGLRTWEGVTLICSGIIESEANVLLSYIGFQLALKVLLELSKGKRIKADIKGEYLLGSLVLLYMATAIEMVVSVYGR